MHLQQEAKLKERSERYHHQQHPAEQSNSEVQAAVVRVWPLPPHAPGAGLPAVLRTRSLGARGCSVLFELCLLRKVLLKCHLRSAWQRGEQRVAALTDQLNPGRKPTEPQEDFQAGRTRVLLGLLFTSTTLKDKV